jgi:broad specificity phosphatase PhoE
VILVRHAMPEVDPEVPHHLWELGPEGRAAARALAKSVEGGRVVTSDEPKALQTAEEIARGEIVVDAGWREVGRPTAWDQDYRAKARRYLAGERLEGWEPREEAEARVRAAAPGDIVVTHGLAMTLYLGQGVRFWEELRFPDAWSALAGHLRRVH